MRRCADETDATHIFEKMPRPEIQAIAGERRHYFRHHQFLVKFVGDDEYGWVAAERILEQDRSKVDDYRRLYPALDSRILYYDSTAIGT
eukprot:SAG31_NODE_39237_length_289_cov_53.484211_1_plen_88_part_10